MQTGSERETSTVPVKVIVRSGSKLSRSSSESESPSERGSERSSHQSLYGSSIASLRYIFPVDRGKTTLDIAPDRELTRDLDWPGLLRTVTAKTVLRGFGRVFRSQGIDSAYALSQECEKLGYFISHSWSAPWLSKYITLSFHFNFWIATSVSFACIVLFLVLGLLYIETSVWTTVRESVNPSLIFVGTGFLTFLPALLFGSELMACFPCLNTNRMRCFLDKCCINQTDPILKRRGIEALGVFLAKSDVLLILWSPDYFLRLWCAYEVAVYMSLAPESNRTRRVIMIPLELVSFSCLVFALDLIIQVVSVNFFFQEPSGLTEDATRITAIVISTIFSGFSYIFAYRWKQHQTFLRKQLAEFSLSKVECSDPMDRPLVLRDIALRYSTLEKATDLDAAEISTTREPSPYPSSNQISSSLSAGSIPSQAGGLRAFEEYVRTNLQAPIEKALGTHHCVLPLKFLLMMSLPAVWAALGLMCHWILKAKGIADEETNGIDESQQNQLGLEAVVYLILSKLLRACTFYPLLTAAILLYQELTENFARRSALRQYVRGALAMLFIGIYVYMFGFHYIFLREMASDVVFYTTLPQVLLFLLIYTRLGALSYSWAKDIGTRCRKASGDGLFCSKLPADGRAHPDRETTRSSTEERDLESEEIPIPSLRPALATATEFPNR